MSLIVWILFSYLLANNFHINWVRYPRPPLKVISLQFSTFIWRSWASTCWFLFKQLKVPPLMLCYNLLFSNKHLNSEDHSKDENGAPCCSHPSIYTWLLNYPKDMKARLNLGINCNASVHWKWRKYPITIEINKKNTSNLNPVLVSKSTILKASPMEQRQQEEGLN